MDKKLFDDICDTVEKINPDIAEGLAVRELKKVEQYIDKVWKSASESFPSNLIYDGYERYTPQDENNLLLKRYDGKYYYELAQTDTFIVKYKFIYKDPFANTEKNFHCDIRLPFVGKGGKMKIMGITYTVMPVAADPVFSASKSDLFVSLNKRNEKFFRFTYFYECNGIKHSASVMWANMFPSNNKTKRSNTAMFLSHNRRNKKVKIECNPLVLYLFCRWGITDTFAKFDAEVKVLNNKEANELNKSEWRLCKSIVPFRDLPTGLIKGTLDRNDLILAVKTKNFSTNLKSVIAAFFYITDYYPNEIYKDFLDEPRQWKIVLGDTAYAGSNLTEGMINQRINNHLASLDSYIDVVTKESLMELGVEVNDMNELFIYMIKNMNKSLLHANPVTMYNKKLTVLPYLLKDVVAGINTFTFDLKIKSNSLSFTTILDLMRAKIKVDRIICGPDKARGTVLVSSSSDNLIYDHTSKVILQSQITNKKNSNMQNNPEEKNIDISVAETGSYGNHTKREPTGRGVLNLFANILPNGMIKRNERLRPLLDKIENELKKL